MARIVFLASYPHCTLNRTLSLLGIKCSRKRACQKSLLVEVKPASSVLVKIEDTLTVPSGLEGTAKTKKVLPVCMSMLLDIL